MRRFLANLREHGFMPQVVVTDGSNLYPAVLAELWPKARHQLCVFHVIRTSTGTSSTPCANCAGNWRVNAGASAGVADQPKRKSVRAPGAAEPRRPRPTSSGNIGT